MSKLVSKIRKGAMWRIGFIGTPVELKDVGLMLNKTPSSGLVTFQPEPEYVNMILNKYPGTELDMFTQRWYNTYLDHETEIHTRLWKEEYGDPITVGDRQLYSFQSRHFNCLSIANRAILGDDRGLGKTTTAVATMMGHNKILVLAPPYLFGQWENTINAMHDNVVTVYKLHGSKSKKLTMMEEIKNGTSPIVCLSSYHSVVTLDYRDFYFGTAWDYIIADEAHCLSNRKNKWEKPILALAHAVDSVLFMTGSDFQTKYPNTIWPLLHGIDPIRFPAYWDFYHMFVESYQDWFGPVAIKPKNLDMLGRILAPLRFRKTKTEVGFELPSKVITRIEVDMKKEHRAAYDEVVRTRMKGELSIPQGIALFSYLQRMVNYPKGLGYEDWQPKTEVISNLVLDIIEEGGKVVIFAFHKDYLRFLQQMFATIKIPGVGNDRDGSYVNAMLIEGDVNPITRAAMCEEFKRDHRMRVLLATYGSGGVGLDLPDVDNAICVEGHWNPEVVGQAIDRIHRITSKNSKNVYEIVAKDSIEEYIWSESNAKKEFIDEVNSVCRIMQKLKGDK